MCAEQRGDPTPTAPRNGSSTSAIQRVFEVEILVWPLWSLRPYASVGVSAELCPGAEQDPSDPNSPVDENETAILYQAGLESRVALGLGVRRRLARRSPGNGASSPLPPDLK